MSSDLTPVGELARLSPAERERCEAMAAVIKSIDDEPVTGSAKRAERVQEGLAESLGVRLSLRQVYRYLASYRALGVVGLADARATGRVRASNVDPRLIELIEAELKEQTTASTGTRSRSIARVEWEAARREVPVPSRRTMYRLLDRVDRHRGSFGAATTRRSKAVRPDRTFHPVRPSRPGELVEIDATPLDVFVQMPDGSVARPELTYAIDVATNTIGATLLHESAAKSVDIGAVLLTRMLTRITDQPWWSDAVSLAERLFEASAEPIRRTLEEAAARVPLIVPETVTVDRGKVFVGSTFTAACERREISQIRANPQQATDKPHVEGGFKRIREGFVQFLAGYSGGNTQDRGAEPRDDAVWTLIEVQLLLDLWIVTSWQTTPHSGLRVAGMPHRSLSPNQMYEALSVVSPHVPVSLSRDEYVALLPLAWRSIQPYGVNFSGLIYDADELHPMRGRQSGLTGEAHGRWEIRYDPYNLRQIWVRDNNGGRWITASWALAAQAEHPFSHEVLRAAQRAIADPGTATTVDVLEQINRIQRERGKMHSFQRGKARATPSRAARVVGLRAVGDSDTPTDDLRTARNARPSPPTARLELLD